MKELAFNDMESLKGGDACAVVTGGTAGGGFAATVGGSIAQGAKLTWRLGGKGLLVGVIAGAIAGSTCYILS